MKRCVLLWLLPGLLLILSGCGKSSVAVTQATSAIPAVVESATPEMEMPHLPVHSRTIRKVVDGALAQTQTTRFYDASYVSISYPDGDVPSDRGVCSDVVIRAFRSGGVDLQRTVHEDMAAHFSAYPHLWGLKRPDTNIDHRRVPNLMTFFTRQGKSLPVTQNASDYRPGDVVMWRLNEGGLVHTGLVTDQLSGPSGTPLIVHNIGAGARLENVLFAWPLIGHYRYFPESGKGTK